MLVYPLHPRRHVHCPRTAPHALPPTPVLRYFNVNVILTPLSPKAESLLTTSLHGNPICSLEQLRDGEIFVTSADRQYSTWIRTTGDPDWAFTFSHKAAPGSQPS